MSTPPIAQPLVQLRIPWQAYAILVIGFVAGATSPTLMRMAQGEGIPSPVIAAGRLTLASLMLAPLTLYRYSGEIRQLTRREWWFILAAGLWLAFHFIMLISSLEYTSILIINVMDGTSPLWIALLEVFFLREQFGRTAWTGLGLALSGTLLIALSSSGDIGAGSNPLFGGALATVGAVAFAFYMVIGRGVRSKVSLLPYIWLVYTSAAVATGIMLLIARIPVAGYSTKGYFWIVMVTLLPQLMTHSAFNYTVKYFPATYVSVFGQLVIVLSALLAFLAFNEIPTAAQIVGGVIIVGGVVAVSVRRPDKQTR